MKLIVIKNSKNVKNGEKWKKISLIRIKKNLEKK